MAKEKEIKTNAMRILDRQKIKYEVLQYECDEFIDGLHTAEKTGAPVELITKGRHDPCVGIRAAPIAEALLALVVMDHALRHRAQCGDVVHAVAPIKASFL